MQSVVKPFFKVLFIFHETQKQVYVFQGTDIDIYFPLNLIRKVPQILIDKNIAYPIEYHLFFLSLGKTNF